MDSIFENFLDYPNVSEESKADYFTLNGRAQWFNGTERIPLGRFQVPLNESIRISLMDPMIGWQSVDDLKIGLFRAHSDNRYEAVFNKETPDILNIYWLRGAFIIQNSDVEVQYPEESSDNPWVLVKGLEKLKQDIMIKFLCYGSDPGVGGNEEKRRIWSLYLEGTIGNKPFREEIPIQVLKNFRKRKNAKRQSNIAEVEEVEDDESIEAKCIRLSKKIVSRKLSGKSREQKEALHRSLQSELEFLT